MGKAFFAIRIIYIV